MPCQKDKRYSKESRKVETVTRYCNTTQGGLNRIQEMQEESYVLLAGLSACIAS